MQIPLENIKTRFFENIYRQTFKKANITIPFDNLDYGIKVLESVEECERYIALYGGHHFYKLRAAFESTNFWYLDNKKVEIIDWGCGQAVATCVLIDYLIENKISPNLLKITLVEPSEIATTKGRELLKQIFQENEHIEDIIKVVNKGIDELIVEDFQTNFENIKIHLFSNIIDVEVFDISKLCGLITKKFTGLNRMICTSPKNSLKRTARLDKFFTSFSESYQINLPFFSDEDVSGDVFIVSKGKFESLAIKRYERQFSIELPPF